MKIIIDTNIFLDLLLYRDKYVKSSSLLMSACLNNKFDAYVASTELKDLFYFAHKVTHSTSKSYEIVGTVLDIAKPLGISDKDILIAHKNGKGDFEDAIIAAAAKRCNIDAIVTRNTKDYKSFGIPIYTPQELL